MDEERTPPDPGGDRIPVHVVAGFLGAGKTTAIRAQLDARRGERVAVVVNDFGEAGFDQMSLSEGEPFRITNIAGGCVCCTAPEGFVAALAAVLDEAPDRILIEPTGLARPQDLVDTIRRSPYRDALQVAPVVVLVDPHQLPSEHDNPLLREQAEIADVLAASRVDLCTAAELEDFEAWARELWPGPLVKLHIEHGKLPPDAFCWPEGEGPHAHRGAASSSHAHTHAGEQGHGAPTETSTAGYRAQTWTWPPAAIFSLPRLRDALGRATEGAFGAPLARFKGIFRTQEGVMQLEVAGGRRHERLTSYRRDSRADAIVAGASDAALASMGAALAGAELSAEELALSANRIELALPDGRTRNVDRDALAALADPVEDVSTLFPKRSGCAARIATLWEELDLPRVGSAVAVALDGFASEPIPVAGLLEGFLLHSVEGEPLPERQGGPFRLLIPEGTPGVPSACANVKGLARIVLRPD